MKDLKYLYEFEKLLESANNPLVQQACAEGKRALASHVITHDYGIPSVAVDRQNATGGNGQLRTRVQAFVESLEIKQLQAQRGGK